MARKGRAGAALTISAVGSFVAGTLGVVALTLLAPVARRRRVEFGPPRVLRAHGARALTLCRIVAASSMLNGLHDGRPRPAARHGRAWTRSPALPASHSASGHCWTASSSSPVIMGLFGVGGGAARLASEPDAEARLAHATARAAPYARRMASVRCVPIAARLRRSAFSSVSLPGRRARVATFHLLRRREEVSKTPERFGTGAIEGVAGPEAANNAATAGAMVPLLSLGIPSCGDGDSARRARDPRAAARPAPVPAAHPTCSGGSSRACTSATSCCWS